MFKSATLMGKDDKWSATLTLGNNMTLNMKGSSLQDVCGQLCDWEARASAGPDAFED